MKIGVVESEPYGGLLHYAFQLSDALARQGADVDLIVSRGNELEGLPTEARMLSVLTPKLGSSSERPKNPIRKTIRRGAIALRLMRAWIRILIIARSRRYDVLIVSTAVQVFLTALFTLALTRIAGRMPLVYVCHNARPWSRSGDNGGHLHSGVLLDRLLRAVYSGFSLILVHGERSKAELISLGYAGEIRVIPHGDERIFSTGEPPPPASEERILFFGNWDRYKGIELLVQSFDLLSAIRPAARLTIAGSPNPHEVDVDEIRRWAAAKGSVELVEGYVPMAEVPAVFARARVVALPYKAAFQSGVAHLAMTLGRAVVTTDVGDIAEAVSDGETGFVVPPEDPGALAKALERTLSDSALAERMGAEGRRRVLAGSAWEKVAERILDAVAVGARR